MSLAVAAPAFAARAQAQSQDQAAVEEVVVVARKREETLMTVPLPVTVFARDDIQTGGARTVEDLARLTPGFNTAPLFGGFNLIPVIRGLSTTLGEPNVGFFVDGVYQSSRAVMDAGFAEDVARIEVLRGPQGALYGRNTFAGAVNIVSQPPAAVLGGRVEGTVGDHGRRAFKASASGPLGDKAGFRAGLSANRRDGFFRNALTGGDLDGLDSKVASGSLELRPAPTLTLGLRAAHERTRMDDFPIRFAVNDAAPARPVGPPFPPAFQVKLGDLSAPSGFAVTPGGNTRRYTALAFTGRWEAPSAVLTWITGANRLDYDQDVDFDYSPRRLRRQVQDLRQDEFSQEVRLASRGEDRLSWMGGVYVYAYRSKALIEDRIEADAAPLAALLPDVLRTQLQGGLTTRLKETTRSAALFGQVAYRFTDRLRLTAEGRYNRERKAVDALDRAQFGGGVGLFADSAWFEHFTPKLTADYRLTDRAMLYASAAKAVKTGGFNVATTTGAIAPDERTYRPETAWHYEAGAKAAFADGRLTVSAAVFHIDWRDQIVRALGRTLSSLNTNAGESRSRGVEIEAAAVPAPGLKLSAGAAYVDARYERYTFGSLAGLGMNPVLDGVRLQYAPEWSGFAAVDYSRRLSGEVLLRLRLDVSGQGRQSVVQPGNSTLPASTVANARAGVERGPWSAAVFVRNLTDEDAPVAATYIADPSARFDVVRGAAGAGPLVGYQAFGAVVGARDPRSFGLTIGRSF